MPNGLFLRVFDLATFAELRYIAVPFGLNTNVLFGVLQNGWRDGRMPMAVDEEHDRLYIAGTLFVRESFLQGNNDLSEAIYVVDLSSGEFIKTIPFVAKGAAQGGAMLIRDIALDATRQKLYVANVQSQSIEVVDLQRLETLSPIALGLTPEALAIDPDRGVLYVAAINRVGATALQERTISLSELSRNRKTHQVLSVDLGQQKVRSSLTIKSMYLLPQMILQSDARRLWVVDGVLFVDPTLPRGAAKGFVIDLDRFQLEGEKGWGDEVTGLREYEGSILVLDRSNLLSRTSLNDNEVSAPIQMGAEPAAVAVSEQQNRVYVARGHAGGVLALDAEGVVINTAEGPPNAGLFVDDISDRLFVLETPGTGNVELGVYELSTLRRLNVAIVDESFRLGFGVVQADSRQGSLWAAPATYAQGVVPWQLFKFDLLTGVQQGRYTFDRDLPPVTSIAIDENNNQLYLVATNFLYCCFATS